jgi:proline iminopeptidase
MSSSGNRRVSKAQPAARRALLSRPADPHDPEAITRHLMGVFGVIGSPAYPTDHGELRERIERSVRRAYYPAGTAHQLLAILASGDRRWLLPKIAAPTLVIHGAADPLVPVAAGRDTAAHIPGAKLMVIDGMGHDLPAPLLPQLVGAIAAHCRAADAARAGRRRRPGDRRAA